MFKEKRCRKINFIEKILIFFKKCGDDAVGAYAAFAAFFTIVSFFPFLMLLLTLLQYLPFSAANISEYMLLVLPSSVVNIINPIIEEIYNASGALISITAIAAIWSASKGVYALLCGLNQVYGVKETRSLIVVRAMSVFYTVVFIIALVASVGLFIFGAKIFNLVEGYAPWLSGLKNLRFVIGILLFVIFFLAIFKALPNHKTRIRDEFSGAVIAAAGWILFSVIYSYYINNFSSFPVIYGSIAAVVFMMLWLYFCMYITLLAAEYNAVRKMSKAPRDIWNVK